MKKITILVIEDEEAIRDMLRFSMPANEFHLIDAENTAKAMISLATTLPDVIILDWMLPDKSGIDFLKMIRKQDLYKNIPIVMLTAKAEEENKVKGLLSGADDYLTKPFSPNELVARIKTVLRRGPIKSPNGEIKIGELTLNTDQCEVTLAAKQLTLTPIEYKILAFFMTHPNKAYSRDQLITHIWGQQIYIDERTIDVQIKRLRSKLKPHHYHTRIKTIRSMGYIFLENANEKIQ